MAATDTATRPAVVAQPMLDDQWIVRGTLDPVTALGALVAEMDGPLFPHDSGEEWADWCYGMLSRAHPNLWRKVPLPPGHELADLEGATWQLRPAKQRGPGVFQGVCFDG